MAWPATTGGAAGSSRARTARRTRRADVPPSSPSVGTLARAPATARASKRAEVRRTFARAKGSKRFVDATLARVREWGPPRPVRRGPPPSTRGSGEAKTHVRRARRPTATCRCARCRPVSSRGDLDGRFEGYDFRPITCQSESNDARRGDLHESGLVVWPRCLRVREGTAQRDTGTWGRAGWRSASLFAPVTRLHRTTQLIKMAAMTSTFLGSAVAVKAPVVAAKKAAVAPVASLDGLKKVRIRFRGTAERKKPIRDG